MILNAHDKLRRQTVSWLFTVVALTVRGVLPVIHKALLKFFGKLFALAEILEVARCDSGQPGMKRVVKIITPLRINAISTEFNGANNPRIV